MRIFREVVPAAELAGRQDLRDEPGLVPPPQPLGSLRKHGPSMRLPLMPVVGAQLRRLAEDSADADLLALADAGVVELDLSRLAGLPDDTPVHVVFGVRP